ncbi:hypothetical protein GCM10009660_00410 [Catellatospora bangladeshensis]|uniref:Uncharacterized protein n=1 Tax=Saccharothrix algeriensis TaxID=173560 RepID=A0ABS2SF91_9PSEU|nr:hypothetical protein [Saccharothrix algeriensis]
MPEAGAPIAAPSPAAPCSRCAPEPVEEVKTMTITIKKVEKPEVSKVRGAVLCG